MALAPAHLEDLRKSGLTDETMRLMGLSSVAPIAIKGVIGKLDGADKVESLLEFPYPNVPGFSRYKIFRHYPMGRDIFRNPAQLLIFTF